MKIAVVGTGYVGLVSGACFADMGNDVICVDVDVEKISTLKSGKIPIYEPGLLEIVERNVKAGRLQFTTDIQEALKLTTMCMIAVGTPMNEDGSADLQYVLAVSKTIGQFMTRHMYVVNKSTVPVGTALKVKNEIQEILDIRKSQLTFDVISNPEFLKEGSAVMDCMKPDRVVIGTDSEEATKVMKELYLPFTKDEQKLFIMDTTSSEMTKYAANAMLATKISFINELSNLCELAGANVNQVRLGIGSDRRIGYDFINPGCGYGGSCFPKDVQALIKTSNSYGYTPKLLHAVEAVNTEQKQVIYKKVIKRYGEDLSSYTFALWGLSYKPNTDDMRYSPAIITIQELVKHGATIHAYDPQVTETSKEFYLGTTDRVSYFEDKYQALKGSNAMILITEWKEFREPDYKLMMLLLREPVIFDGRNQYDAKQMKLLGFEYHGIGIPS